REARLRQERQPKPGLQLEERHGPVLGLLAHDPPRRQAEAITVEPEGPLEIIDGEGDEGDAWLHGSSLRCGCSDNPEPRPECGVGGSPGTMIPVGPYGGASPLEGGRTRHGRDRGGLTRRTRSPRNGWGAQVSHPRIQVRRRTSIQEYISIIVRPSSSRI